MLEGVSQAGQGASSSPGNAGESFSLHFGLQYSSLLFSAPCLHGETSPPPPCSPSDPTLSSPLQLKPASSQQKVLDPPLPQETTTWLLFSPSFTILKSLFKYLNKISRCTDDMDGLYQIQHPGCEILRWFSKMLLLLEEYTSGTPPLFVGVGFLGALLKQEFLKVPTGR